MLLSNRNIVFWEYKDFDKVFMATKFDLSQTKVSYLKESRMWITTDLKFILRGFRIKTVAGRGLLEVLSAPAHKQMISGVAEVKPKKTQNPPHSSQNKAN